MIGKIFRFPFWLVAKLFGGIFGIVKLVFRIIFGIFRFMSSHALGTIIGATIGFLLGRKHFGMKLGQEKKD